MNGRRPWPHPSSWSRNCSNLPPMSSRFLSIPITVMPSIVGDEDGTAHALWIGEIDEETGESPLLYAQLPAGRTSWTDARTVSGSASAYAATVDASGALHVVYIRNLDTEGAPSGVVYLRSPDAGGRWDPPVAIHESLYYRLAASDSLRLRIAADADGNVVVTWNDPHTGQALVSRSSEDGEVWSAPRSVGGTGVEAVNAHPYIVRGNQEDTPYVIWEGTDSLGACVLYQESTDELVADDPVAGQRAVEGLSDCPNPANELLLSTGHGRIVMLSGAGTDTLVLRVQLQAAWSEPKSLTFRFDDPQTGTTVYLDSLNGTLIQTGAGTESTPGEEPPGGDTDAIGEIVIVGTDTAGDVWATQSRVDALDLAFAPPSPWSVPSPLSVESGAPDLPTVVTDPQGWIHAVWAEAETMGQPGKVLRYARWSESGWTRPSTILASTQGSASEPSIAVLGERIHARMEQRA